MYVANRAELGELGELAEIKGTEWEVLSKGKCIYSLVRFKDLELTWLCN